MARQPGSMWVAGAYLYYVAEDGHTFQAGGTSAGLVSGSVPGSLWVAGDRVYYIDESRYKRYLPYSRIGTTTGVAGSAWVEGDWVHYLAETDRDEHTVHEDFSNWSDAGYTDWDDHADSAHSDTAHSDWNQHSDVPQHIDWSDWQNWIDIGHVHTIHQDYNATHVDHADHQDVAYGDSVHLDWSDYDAYAGHSYSWTNLNPIQIAT